MSGIIHGILAALAGAVKDTYFNYVVLLLKGDNIIGTASSYLTDASTNNFNLVETNDVRNNTFNPFNGTYYSNYFDGNGDYLTVPANSAFDFGTGNFTIEAWANLVGPGTGDRFIVDQANGTRFLLRYNSSGVLQFYISSSLTLSTTVNIIGSWSHIVVVRSGTTISMFLNGSRVSTTTNSSSVGSSTDTVGIGAKNTGGTDFWQGYISNVRIVKGIAVYDPSLTSLTVPTAPLTAVSGTSLLTCQSNRFIDNSINNFTITRNGDVAVHPNQPFVLPESTAGSAYFVEANVTYLDLPSSANLNVGSGQFTIEAWIYPTSGTGWRCIYQFGPNYDDGLYISPTNTLTFYRGGVLIQTSQTVLLNEWSHVAATRDSFNNVWVFLNGTTPLSAGSSAYSFNDNTPRIGANGSGGERYTGFISNLRLLKGTALYTTNFTPPTSPLTAITNTSLLTLQSRFPARNSGFLDTSPHNLLITRTGNVSQDRFTPYGTEWSYYFQSGENYLSTPSSTSFNFGTGDYCIEAWVYLIAYGSGPAGTNSYTILFSSSGANHYWGLRQVSGNVWLSSYDGSVVHEQSSGSQFQLATWNHVAYVKNSGNYSMYLNGVSVYSAATNTSWGATAAFNVGASPTYYPTYYNTRGYMSDVRVVKGSPVYTSNFSAPTSRLTAISGTSLLTCQNNRFLDNSTNNFSLSTVGSVAIRPFDPYVPIAPYTSDNKGGNAFFDGVSDWLSVQDNPVLDINSSFTLECWAFFSLTTDQVIINRGGGSATWDSTSGHYYMLIYTGGNWVWRWNQNNSSTPAQISGTARIRSWNHIAVGFDGTTTRLWINGVSAGTSTTGYTVPATRNLTNIGRAVSNEAYVNTGGIGGLRLVKGTDVYGVGNSNITVPTSPLTAINNTSLLLNFTNAGVVDSAASGIFLETVGNCKISTTQSKYGNSSMSFDGGTTYISLLRAEPLCDWFSGSYTIEYWIYPNAFASSVNGGSNVYGNAGASSSTEYFSFGPRASGVVVWYYYNGSSQVVTSGTISTGVWTHLAMSYEKSSNTLRIFINGTLTTSHTVVGTPTIGTQDSAAAILVGAGANVRFNGYIDDLRITYGVARYTATFTPPQEGFPIQ